MANEPEYQVLPEITPSWQREMMNALTEATGGIGCFVFLSLFISAILIFGARFYFLPHLPFTTYELALETSLLTVLFFATTYSLSKRRFDFRRKVSLRRAEQLSNELNALYRSASSIASLLPDSLKRAMELIGEAQSTHASLSVESFWDNIETAAQHLASIHHGIDAIAKNAGSFYEALDGRQHNFPTFNLLTVPSSSAVAAAEDLRNVVRQAIRNPAFASGWDQKKSEPLLNSGYREFGYALEDLPRAIQVALDELNSSLPSETPAPLDTYFPVSRRSQAKVA
jgi:hypothetical protein